MTRPLTGLERFALDPSKWVGANRNAGLLYNSASLDSKFASARDVVAKCLGGRLKTLFGPQHGVNSDVQDNMIETGHATDHVTGLPVWSLYSRDRKPTRKMLRGLDLLLVDLTDVGTRVYTFIWTLRLAMEACGEAGIKVVVLDRPNPIGGNSVEGNLLSPEFSSFVGLEPIPMRHGMTVGELARWFVESGRVKCELEVLPVKGWKRGELFPRTGLPWAPPSPNMPLFETALVYPGMVLLEGTNASEGRGTTRPFETVGVPWGKPEELARELNALALPGVHFRPLVFMPTFHKWAGRAVNGVFLQVTAPDFFRPYKTGLALLSTLWRLYADEGFAWRSPPYEYEEKELPIHLLLGSRVLRERIEKGVATEEMEADWMPELDHWQKERKACLLY